DFTVILKIRAANGTVYDFANCHYPVDVIDIPTIATVYNPPGCNDKTFTVDVTSPTLGYTYSIDQPGNDEDFSSQDQTPTAQNPDVHFTGLIAGDGFIVTVTTDQAGCTATSECEGSTNTNSCTANETLTRTPTNSTNVAGITEKTVINPSTKTLKTHKIVLESPTKVNAVPNPYTDKIRFDLVSGVSGYGSLELYNVLGQKIGVVYQGYIQAGRPLYREYSVSKGSSSTMIYVFKVGDQKVTGRLIGIK
ncbi:hypothetical protein, partial [Terrimonas alba]|uniref:hypothetical protein n=1 Tax=Terrimonas alba TaxID=3349636 RepID=UPI0035F44EDC